MRRIVQFYPELSAFLDDVTVMILHCLVYTDISECTGIDFGLLEITEVEEVEEIEVISNRACVEGEFPVHGHYGSAPEC